ncbi:transcriptional regulator with XRE-family HTH domain [Kibdelosporangium banguiense]|uniref:Transcriptional regulator with XRE-family HTH domain n=1 Tax=Kibdelosporangium banguiense TaxID=1365924 RepID=A0ABS4TS07_9PSEU|nr:transcriptional regulator with XRE-family HTH domain [Kibdelosporangium banguiense]
MTNTARAKLATDLDELRLLAGLSYRELARRSGCARSTLHDALTGRRFPRLETVLAIVQAGGGNVANWRERWTCAVRQRPDEYPLHAPGTAARMSRQSTSPS